MTYDHGAPIKVAKGQWVLRTTRIAEDDVKWEVAFEGVEMTGHRPSHQEAYRAAVCLAKHMCRDSLGITDELDLFGTDEQNHIALTEINGGFEYRRALPEWISFPVGAVIE